MVTINDVLKFYNLSHSFYRNGLIKANKLSGRVSLENLPISIQNLNVLANVLYGDNSGVLVDKGTWVSGITYYRNDVVKHEGTIWRCVVDETTEEPGVGEDWLKMVDETDSITVEGWGHTLTFTAGVTDAVTWSSGSIILGDGTTYSINSGTTGSVSVETYIYLDVGTSETDLQVTTVKSNCFGEGKILVAIANLNATLSKTTVFDLTGSDTVIDNGSILARSITANEIYANTITSNEINTSSINLSEFSGNLDNIANGTTYSRVKTTAISAGNIILSETIGDLDDIDDGTSYSRVASASLTAGGLVLLSQASGDLDDISDGSSYGKINKTSISAGNILLSTAVQSSSYRTVADSEKSYWSGKPDDMDDIPNGTTYAKVLSTSISAGKIILSQVEGDLDDIANGTYSKVLSTEVSAGHIKITGADGTTTVIDGGQIQALSIKAGDIAADAITATKIDVTNLSSINSDLGAITAGSITINGGVFQVTSAGALTATSANISGTIDANSGTLGTLTVDGAITVNTGGSIASADYSAGTTGWTISKDGSAEFDNVTIRGTSSEIHWDEVQNLSLNSLFANTITLTGSGNYIQSDGFITGTTGWQISEDGSAEFNDVTVRGSLNADDIDSGTLSADRIGASSITATKLNVSTLSSITANMGTLTAGLIAISGAGVKIGQNAYNSRPGFFINSENRWIETEASPQQVDFQVGGSNGITYTEISGSGIVELGDVEISGDSYVSGSLIIGASKTSGQRVVLDPTTDKMITFYDSSGSAISLYNDTTSSGLYCAGRFKAQEVNVDGTLLEPSSTIGSGCMYIGTGIQINSSGANGIYIGSNEIVDVSRNADFVSVLAEDAKMVTSGGAACFAYDGYEGTSTAAVYQLSGGATGICSTGDINFRVNGSNVGKANTSGIQVQQGNFISTDGSAGATGTATSANTLTIKNGIITNIA